MYQGPIITDPDRPCYECKHYDYDSWHDEAWCYNPNEELNGPFRVSGNGTCENFINV